MDRAALVDRVADMIAGMERHPLGMAGLMIDGEVRAGRRPVQPGSPLPFAFPIEEWPFPQVVSLDGAEVRLIAIRAATPGSGALRRLVNSISSAGLRPVIVEPVGATMPAILKHWRWKRRIVGRGWERFEEWRPIQTATPLGSARVAPEDGQLRDEQSKAPQ